MPNVGVAVTVTVSLEASPSVVLPFTVKSPDSVTVSVNKPPTSKITSYFELFVFVSNGKEPLDVCAAFTMYIEPSVVSLTKSLST